VSIGGNLIVVVGYDPTFMSGKYLQERPRAESKIAPDGIIVVTVEMREPA